MLLVVMSMTGFGAAEHVVGERQARVEIRTVNHRFFNLAARLPAELAGHEAALKELLRQAIDRGHVAVTVQWLDSAPAAVAIDQERAVAAHAAIEQLRHRLGVAGTVTLDHVLRFPDVLGSRRPDGAAVDWSALRPAVEASIAACQATRAAEGAALAADIRERLAAMAAAAAAVEQRLPERLERELARLREAVSALLGETAVSPERLAMEIALLADRVDVTEELVRLRAHLAAAEQALAAAGPVGKRLGFLAQEIGREVNTIGSKANDAAIAHLVVEMKSELEKVREQVENIE